MTGRPLPHPIPYQGSKRRLADEILSVVAERRFETLYEPFAGSAAITLAAAARGLATAFSISDSLMPLVQIWRRILAEPAQLAAEYDNVWSGQLSLDPKLHFLDVRTAFNRSGGEAQLLYLLARCVKNSPRFNKDGRFNQSADHRRSGMRPAKMRGQLVGASSLLAGRTDVRCCEFEDAVVNASPADLIYLDPPWEGTSTGRDRRYHSGLERERLISFLGELTRRRVPFLLSYDGRHGTKTYGALLPEELQMTRLELHAGRSSQATLLGRAEHTVESLYVSASLAAEAAKVQLRLFDERAA